MQALFVENIGKVWLLFVTMATKCYCTQQPVQVSFITKFKDQESCCKPWMSISPSLRVILPGVNYIEYVVMTTIGSYNRVDSNDVVIVYHS